VKIDTLLDVESVYSDPSNEWALRVFEIVSAVTHVRPLPSAVAYFTDASALAPATGRPPTLILGPGEASMAHKTDEYCLISRLHQSLEIYKRIICDWCRL
jgi:succinyl-diaminopimelate desuccinylase